MQYSLSNSGLIRSKEDLRQQYQDASNLHARAAIYRYGTAPQPWLRWVFDQLQIPEGSRVLELGCGSAGLWRANLDRLPGSWRIILSDLMAGMLKAARESLADHLARFRWVQMDAQAISLSEGGCEVVLANHMLYHIPARQRALREIQRVLAPGGRLYDTTIGDDHMRAIRDLRCRFMAELTETIRRHISTHGAFRVLSESGMFIARR